MSLKKILAGAALLGMAGMSQAAVNSSFDAGTGILTVDITAGGDTATISRGTGGQNNQIQVNGVSQAARNNVNGITITDSSAGGAVTVALNETNGALNNGGTPIPITISGGTGATTTTYNPGAGVGTANIAITDAGGTDSFSLSLGAAAATPITLNISGANAGSFTGAITNKSFSGIDSLNFNAGSFLNALTVSDTSGAANTAAISGLTATGAAVALNGVTATLSNVNVTPSYVGGGQVGDTLTVNATNAANTINISDAGVTLTGLLGANYSGYSQLNVNALDGNDSVTVAGGSTQTIFADGGNNTDTIITNSAVNLTHANFETIFVPVGVSEIKAD